MKVLNILSTGGVGGIEVLYNNIGLKSSIQKNFCFMFGRGIIYDEMKANGLNVMDLSKCGKKISIKKLTMLNKISKEFDICVLHHELFFSQLYFWLLSKLNKKTKLVMTLHSSYDINTYDLRYNIKSIFRKKMLKMSINSANHIIFVSEAVRKSYMEKFKIDISKTDVIYNGINNEILEKGKKSKVSYNNRIDILYIGRLTKIKGVDLLIKATEVLCKRYKIKLTIVGDGEERERLQRLVNDLGLNEIICFVGTQREIDKFLAKTNIFVYPSICQEAFGISVVEALAYGIPCVTNQVGGLVEIIENEKNGFFTQNIDYNSLSKAIEKAILCYEDGQIEYISEYAKSTARQFTIDKTIFNLEKSYSKLINN